MQYKHVIRLIFTFVLLLSPHIISSALSKSPSILEKPETIQISLHEIVKGLRQPISLVHANKDGSRLFIAEQAGMIQILQNGQISKTAFLDIRDRVSSGGETGLLGLAFHPGFSKNRRFFVNYTSSEPRLKTVISEFTASDDLKTADPKSEKILMEMPQPFSNHNGGQIAFGPDGKLYIGMGDGGAGNDPEGNAQNTATLLGSLLRIDVDQKTKDKAYGIPKDNPFRRQSKTAPEIWAYGLRNPWRFSFDSETGALYLGDVGQNSREEINLIRRGGNYGWNVMEGAICTPGLFLPCDPSRYAAPLLDYPRSEGTTVIGGYVYRGRAIPALNGAYLYGDFGNGRIWMLRHEGKKVRENVLLLETNRMISAFGEDEQGELYILDYKGKILKIVPK